MALRSALIGFWAYNTYLYRSRLLYNTFAWMTAIDRLCSGLPKMDNWSIRLCIDSLSREHIHHKNCRPSPTLEQHKLTYTGTQLGAQGIGTGIQKRDVKARDTKWQATKIIATKGSGVTIRLVTQSFYGKIAWRVQRAGKWKLSFAVLLLFTCGWFWSDRSACRLSVTIHPFRLFNVLGTKPARVSQFCASIFACDGSPSISKSGGVIVHDTVVIIRDSARVDGIWGHLGELRANSWRTQKGLNLKWRKVLRTFNEIVQIEEFLASNNRNNKMNSHFQNGNLLRQT